MSNEKFKFGYNTKDISIQTTDGTVYEIGYIGNCAPNCADIWIKLANEKRRIGVTYFAFTLQKNKIVADGSTNSDFLDRCDINNKNGSNNYIQGRGCTAWALINSNMDYLHCDDLSWNGKRKCK